MKQIWSCLACVVPVLFCGTVYAGVIDPGLLTALKTAASDEPLPVIIRLSKPRISEPFRQITRAQRRSRMIRLLQDSAETLQKPVHTFLKRRASAGLSLWMINGIAASVKPEIIRELSQMAMIESITLDAVLTAPEHAPGDPSMTAWNLNALAVPELWRCGITGAGVVIASMDTGVDAEHPDLKAQWRGGTGSWFDPHGEHETPYDGNGHGTQIMGVMVGGARSGQAIGMAPEARWIAVKIFNDADEALLSNVHQGFQWLLDPDGNPDTDDAPAVVNNSWGMADNPDQCITEFEDDIVTLIKAGIVIVHSAGNGGPFPSSSMSPANYPEGFGVGAVDESLTIAYFSSRGPSACDGAIYPQVVAPGVNVTTADLTLGGIVPDSYTTVTGTSLASAHAAGAMALLMSAFPGITVQDLVQAVHDTAADLGNHGPDNTYGYGLIDCMAAYTVFAPLPCTTTTSTPTTSLPTSSTSTSTTSIPGSWPMAYAQLWGDRTDVNLRVLRRYRDTFLSRTDTGRKYIALLYDNSLELCALLMHDEKLLEKTREAVHAIVPEIESLIVRGEMKIPPPVLTRLLSLASDFEANASPKLQAELRKVVDSLYEEEVRRELRIAIRE